MADGKQDDLCARAIELLTRGDCLGAVHLLESIRPRAVCHEQLLALSYFRLEHYERANELLEGMRDSEDEVGRALRKLSAANARAGLPAPNTLDREFDRKVVLEPPKVADTDLPERPMPSPRTWRRALERAIGDGAGVATDMFWRGLQPWAARLHEKSTGIWTDWDQRSRPVGLAMLASMRDQLEKRNLKNPYPPGSLTAFQLRGLVRPRAAGAYRTPDGSWNDPSNPREGSANVRFPRNVDAKHAAPEAAAQWQAPNPALISQELLARGPRDLEEVPFLNLLAAAWIQFMVHDWVSHRTYAPSDTKRDRTIDIPVPAGHPLAGFFQQQLRVGKTMPDPTRRAADDGSPATAINEVTSWWDASQIYGSDAQTMRLLRSESDGKLRLDDGWLPMDENGAELAGYTRNWWVGLSMLTTLFVKEHNAICDELKAHHPSWDDDLLFHTARLVNAAVLAKLHTVEWTPAILPNPTLTIALEANWYGLLERTLFRRRRKTLRRIKIKNGVLGGLVGNRTTKLGVPYGLSEEFVEVYRLHELLPDHLEVHQFGPKPRLLQRLTLPAARGNAAPGLMRKHGLANLLYSFGIQSPGAINLHNYPNSLRQLGVTGAPLMDVAAVDILRSRERGVPRYNEFRRQLGLRPIEKFEDLTNVAEDVIALKQIYGDVEAIDMHVGTRAEQRRPQGFGFGETLFQVFILNASRRLQTDHFFTEGYNADNYTQEGLAWIDRATFKSVLLRHHPELAATGLAGVENAFEPWDTQPALDPKRHPLRSISQPSLLQQLGDGALDSIQAADRAGREAFQMLRDRAERLLATPQTADLVWGIRRRVWDGVLLLKFILNQRDRIPPPPQTIDRIDYFSLRKVVPSIPIDAISVADHVPPDEANALKRGFYMFQLGLTELFGPQQPGLRSIGPNSTDNLRRAYGRIKRHFVPAPVLPEALQGAVPDLGALAMAGPYWGYLIKTGPDAWEWDLRGLGQFEHLPGLRKLGVRVRFGRDISGRKPEATAIECELGEITPAQPDWQLAVKLALCAITTQVSLVRHFNAIHLAFGAKFSQATRNCLPTQHPLFRLVWPHIHDTQFSNEIVTLAQLTPHGDFPAIFSFSYAGLCGLFEHTHAQLRLSSFDPERDAQARGESGEGLDTPGLDDVKRIFDVIHAHVSRYVSAYYGSEAALLADPALRMWLEEMRAHMPNGLPLESADLSRATLARLIAVLLNVVIVEHALRDALPWDYVLFSDRTPIRVYANGANGQGVPLDVYQRHVNANMLFQLPRTLLTKDFSYLALDRRGAQIFRDFRANLLALQASVADEPRRPGKLYPVDLNANMNA